MRMTAPQTGNGVHSVGRLALAGLALAGMLAAAAPAGAQAGSQPVTFAKDVAPILQRSCENCHRPGGGAPMSLITYEDVRPWARAVRSRTEAREMPPWFIDKNIGIQAFKDDPSLSEAEIATIAAWVDGGARRGDPADMPPPREWPAGDQWSIGEPDLVVSSPLMTVEAVAPDWFGMINPPVPTGLTTDRWVKAVEIREVLFDEDGLELASTSEAADGKSDAARADLNLYVVHHAVIMALVNNGEQEDHPNRSPDPDAGVGSPDGSFGIIHELGQNATVFPDYVGVKLPAESVLAFTNMHLHSIGTKVRARVDAAFKLHPEGYEPKYLQVTATQAGGYEMELDIPAGESNILRDGFYRLTRPAIMMTFEPHLHSSGTRMCLEALYPNNARQMLNCADYNHNWVRVYVYEDEAAPLLPAGTVLHMLAWFDNSPSNSRVSDPRNWKGWGNRSIDDMFFHLPRMVYLTEEQFEEEVAARGMPQPFAASQDQQ